MVSWTAQFKGGVIIKPEGVSNTDGYLVYKW